MEAKQARFLDLLRKAEQFVIPIYQRTYSWTERECRQYWDDIIRTGNDESISSHFVGSIVYIEKGLAPITGRNVRLLIDGQQRLTTLMLILEALARTIGDRQPVNGFSATKIRNRYLSDPDETGEDRYKLLLTQKDRESLKAIIDKRTLPTEPSIQIKENFEFFKEGIEKLNDDKIASVCTGLSKLMIVEIALSRGEDNPQLIFESMNSTGRELSQADLIRNFVLMGLDQDDQERLYEWHWHPMEVAFGQEAYSSWHFDRLMRYFLTLKLGYLPNVGAVYEAFKEYSRLPIAREIGMESLVAEIHVFADYYCALVFNREKDNVFDKKADQDLAHAFRDLRELKADVAYPLLLELYDDYVNELLPKEDFVTAVRLVESYVFRRSVCGIPTNSMNKTFATFSGSLHKGAYLESIRAHFLLMPSYRRFPNDTEFTKELVTRDLYNFARRSYWLRRLENHKRKEFVSIDDYSIGHILPQNDTLGPEWQSALGQDWQQVQRKWVHTLGNLTLTGWNPELSDRPFEEKRDMKKFGFKMSPLWLNEGLGSLDDWNEDAIRERAAKLAGQATEVWEMPRLTDDVLLRYRPDVERPTGYTLSDYPNLVEGSPMGQLFDEFRKEVLALDECVREEVRKHYIAYKAETNFVSVYPLVESLNLILNLAISELHDTKGKAMGIDGLARGLPGDVKVNVDSSEDIRYVIGLVRQALDKQMSDSEGER